MTCDDYSAMVERDFPEGCKLYIEVGGVTERHYYGHQDGRNYRARFVVERNLETTEPVEGEIYVEVDYVCSVGIVYAHLTEEPT